LVLKNERIPFCKNTNIGGEMSTRNSAIACQVIRKNGNARFEVSAAVNTEVDFSVVALCGIIQWIPTCCLHGSTGRVILFLPSQLRGPQSEFKLNFEFGGQDTMSVAKHKLEEE
jgi:hypothetical protein